MEELKRPEGFESNAPEPPAGNWLFVDATRRAAMIDATPLPSEENPGMKKLQPQNMPAGNLYITARAAKIKPMPTKMLTIPLPHRVA